MNITLILPIVILSASFLGISACAEERFDWPDNILEASERKEVVDLSVPVGLNLQYPEYFDWQRYILEDGSSTYNQRLIALQALSILWKRLLTIEERERKERLRIGGLEYAESFDEMQKQWRKLCEKECIDFAGPSNIYKGSGHKVRYPSFIVQQILDRINFLNIER